MLFRAWFIAVCCAVAVLGTLMRNKDADAQTLVPFIIIPCSTGSRLEAKLTNKKTAYEWCPRNSDWFNLFVPTDEELVPPHLECVGENLQLSYNASTGQYSNFPGVEIRVPDYGNTTAVEYLVPPDGQPLYHELIQMLVDLGYERGVNLRAAPYDWRLGPTGYNASFAQLKALVEETYAMNNNTRVVLHSFSLGAPYVHLFLTQYVDQAWKDQYISRLIAISAAVPGTAVCIQWTLFIRAGSGIPWFVPKTLVTKLAESLGEPYWMLPDADLFGDHAFVSTPDRNYSASDFVQMFLDAKKPGAAAIVEGMLPYKVSLTPPGVDVVCLYGYNVSTPLAVRTNSTTLDETAAIEMVYGDGDNCVLRPGLELCDTWAALQPQPSKSIAVANMQHGDGLDHPLAFQLVLESLGL